MIAGLGKAAELVADNVMTYEEHMRTIRDYLEQQLEVYVVHVSWYSYLVHFISYNVFIVIFFCLFLS